MILTRRGYVALMVVSLGIANAWLYGPRSLNAVVAPVTVALAWAAVTVRRIDRPTLERTVPEEGFVGESHTARLRFSAERTFTGHVEDTVPEDLEATGNELTTGIGETTVAYDLTFARRGAYHIGPTTVTARDVLGFAQKTFTYRDRQEVLVYPRIRSLGERARQELNLLPDLDLIDTRGEFDGLREYQRGDSLRDVDWKSSARQPDDELIVKEYVDDEDLGEIHIAAETEWADREALEGERARKSADAMAEAAASITDLLLETGLSVGITAPDGVVEPGAGSDQRRTILDLLARTGPGPVPPGKREDANLLIRADGPDATVYVDGETVPFNRLVGEPADEPAPKATGG